MITVSVHVNMCDVCHNIIVKDAHGGPHPSPGDHDPAYHVAKAYHTGWIGDE